MKICGVAAEFNPFHKGHKLLADRIHENGGYVLAVMSGNFVQRGECAVFSKEVRARSAVENGVDLVIELPLIYALGAAERFAHGCVDILNACSIVDEMWFGSECGDINMLTEAANAIFDESTEFKNALNKNLADGMSFPAARGNALGKLGELLKNPNNILATEYICALKKSSSKIKSVTILREGASYHETNENAADFSASAARRLLKNGSVKSEYTPLFISDFDILTAARIKASTLEELCTIADCNEEIAARLLKASENNTFEEIVNATLCRRYTRGRIQRVICNALIGNKFRDYIAPSYIRPLAFNENGAAMLRKISESSTLPVVSRGALVKDDPIFQLECRGTDLYNLVRGVKGGAEFTCIPQKI